MTPQVVPRVSPPSTSLRKATETRLSSHTTIALSMAVSIASLYLPLLNPLLHGSKRSPLHNLSHCSETVGLLSLSSRPATLARHRLVSDMAAIFFVACPLLLDSAAFSSSSLLLEHPGRSNEFERARSSFSMRS